MKEKKENGSARFNNIFRSTREKEKTISRTALDDALEKLVSSNLEELIARYVDEEFEEQSWRLQAYYVASCIDELLLHVDAKVPDDYINMISENIYNHCDSHFKSLYYVAEEEETIESLIKKFVENFEYPEK